MTIPNIWKHKKCSKPPTRWLHHITSPWTNHPTWCQDPSSTGSTLGKKIMIWPSIWASVDIKFKVWPTEGLEQIRNQFHVRSGCCTICMNFVWMDLTYIHGQSWSGTTCQLPICFQLVSRLCQGIPRSNPLASQSLSCEGKPWVLWICHENPRKQQAIWVSDLQL